MFAHTFTRENGRLVPIEPDFATGIAMGIPFGSCLLLATKAVSGDPVDGWDKAALAFCYGNVALWGGIAV